MIKKTIAEWIDAEPFELAALLTLSVPAHTRQNGRQSTWRLSLQLELGRLLD
jgi:hypothetical protein